MSAPSIHPTAIVGSGARLGVGVRIGPFCIVGDEVVLGDGVELVSHAVVEGLTEIGAGTRIFPFASIGHQPQDLKYEGEPSRVVIGARCVIREAVTINPGTRGGIMETRIGDDCLIMANAHVAHDCVLGNHVILANYVGVAGHCTVGDYVIFGGICVVHQYVRIGSHAFIGAQSMVDADVIPYGMALGNRANLAGLNLVGLKRRGFDREAIHSLRAAYRMIFSTEGTLRERVEDAAQLFESEPMVQDVVAFITAAKDRAICMPRNGHHG
ncbi:acyl-ACP--UDP-N-acetylglucosamine O-acyltransferase [Arsenicitalea aurantiaca]|uniref:Acyl-[acyl-carrier-protein]--UDP-N-acetylglucosamine O-acyltransferase n=1 Tax=Arsenicitalea aurantiaca TaxID=1783274 RepID=A0A433XF96_9HYPH|nr:acyl-ACP--UDP-N-acetylglucosamine O-acyltransferase [Arsenicitalea aurantiaca]RUT32730.1 acyl-ACP--UDP-N-acetylglucosamine O-acyltransferase [Arsenicitalea aurantiaca]